MKDRAELAEQAARLLRDHVAGENVDELMHHWADQWGEVTNETYRGQAAPARPEASTDVPAWDGNHLLVSRGGPMTYRVATEADLRAAGYVRLTRRTRPEIGLEPESEPPGNTGMRPDATDAVIAECNRVCTCPRSGPKSPSVGMIRRPAIIIGHQPRCPALDVLARAAR